MYRFYCSRFLSNESFHGDCSLGTTWRPPWVLCASLLWHGGKLADRKRCANKIEFHHGKGNASDYKPIQTQQNESHEGRRVP